MKKIVTLFLVVNTFCSFAQAPSNDNCSNATPVTIPSSGSICFSSSNATATSDGQTDACDTGAPGNEIWYTFISTGVQNTVTVTPNGSAPATNVVLSLTNSTCGSGTYQVCNVGAGAGTATTSFGYPVGTQVWFSIETNGTDGTFNVCISSITAPPAAGEDCANASKICSKATIDYTSYLGHTSSGVQPSCFGFLSPAQQDVWVKFTVGTTGTLEWNGVPVNITTEWDWAIFNITGGCPGSEVACNWFTNSGGSTGFGMLPGGTNDYNAPITVTAGQTYAILIDNYSMNNTGFTLSWGGTFEIAPVSNFTVTPNQSCGTLNAAFTNTSAAATTYNWNFGDGTASTATNPPNHTYTTPGNYLVSLTTTSSTGCTDVSTQVLSVTKPVVTTTTATPNICVGGSSNLTGTVQVTSLQSPITFSKTVNTNIPDNNATGVASTINVTGIYPTTVSNSSIVSVCLNILHTRDQDLDITLTSPCGFTIDLSSDNGAALDNYSNTCFSPTSATAITAGSAPFSGSFTPEQSFALLNGCANINGAWILTVKDDQAGQTGSFTNWDITFNNQNSYTYNWSPTINMTNPTTLNPTVSPTTTTTYTLTATDVLGCTANSTVTVTVNPPPNANAGADQVITCASASVLLNGSSSTAGATFNWTGPGIVSGGSTATPIVNATGTYTLTVTAAGCTNTDQVSVTTNTTPPNANAGADKTITCATTSVLLNGSSSTTGVTFSWAGPGIVSGGTTATPTVNAAGTYTLTVTNPVNGCTANDIAVINSNVTPPNANAGIDKTITCATTSVLLNGSSSTTGATFSWAGPGIVSGGTTATPTVNANGTYTITVTDPINGCTSTDMEVINSNTIPPNANAGSDQVLTCATTSVVLNGSSSTVGVSYSWAGPSILSGGATATPTVNGAGTYTITVTDPTNGCTATDQAAVTPSAGIPNVNAGADQTLTCTITSVTLNGSSSTAGATFSWAGPGIVSGATTTTPTVNASGTYTLTVTDPGNGCSATDQAVVNINATPPNANAGADQTLTCSITSVILNGSSSTAGATFNWTGPGIVSGGTTATPTVNAVGTYTLTITNPLNACTTSDQAVVNNSSALPNVNAGTDKTITCIATSVVFNGSSTTTGVVYSWAGPGIVSGGTTATPTANAAGTYTITVTDPVNGCTANDQVVVNNSSALPNANAGTDKTITCAAITVVLNGSSSTAGVTFSWAGPGIVSGGTTATPTVNVAGTYTITVTDPINGCTATDQTVVTPSAGLPNVNSGADQTLTCTVTSVVLNGSSSTVGATFSWSGAGIVSGGTTASPTVNAAGTYTLTVSDPGNGCSSTDSVVVNTNTTLPNANAGIDQTLTCTTTSVVLSGSSSTASATFSWSGSGIVSDGSTATPTVNAGGFYILTVTDPVNGCTATDQAAVSANITSPTANAGTDQTITCALTAVPLDGSLSSAGMNYSWSGPGGYTAATQTTTTTTLGTFTLTVTNPGNGCFATDQIVVNSNTTFPNANAGADQTLTCAAPSVTLNGSSTTAGVTFSWSGPSSYNSTLQSPSVSIAGTYTITVTDPINGCTATDQIIVTPSVGSPSVDAGADQTLTCTISSTVLNGSSSTAGITYSWNGPGIVSGGTTATPTVNAAGTYTLTVADPGNGCSATDLVTVNSNTTTPASNAGSDQVITCSITSVTLDGSLSTSAMNYNWNGPGGFTAGTQSTSASASGTYTLTVTDPINGCVATDQVDISPSAGLPNVNAGSDQLLTCTTTLAPLNGSSSTAGVTYSWSGPGGFSGTTQSTTASIAGTYSLTVTDPSNGCSSTDQVIVSNNTSVPTANAGSDQMITCVVTTVSLDGSFSSAAMNYNWSGPGGFAESTQITSATAAGTYTLTVTDPANGCIAIDQADITLAAGIPTASAGADQLLTCAITSVNLSGSLSSAGMSYIWTGPAGFTAATQSTTTTVAGTYTITVTNTANGCSSNDLVLVNSNTVVPAANVSSSNNTFCFGNNTILNAAPVGTTYTYAWLPAAGLNNATNPNPTATPTVTTTYTLTVTDGRNGCNASNNILITVYPLPNPVFSSGPTSGCAPLCVKFTDASSISSGSVTGWGWNFNDGTGTGITPTHCFINPGTYSIILTDTSAEGCIASSVIPYVVTVNPNPVASISAPLSTSILNPTVQYTDESTPSGTMNSWNWNFGDPLAGTDSISTLQNPTHTFSEEGTYCAQLIVSSNGCKDTVPYCIVIDPEFTFFIPNGFSPNDDGVNDEFYGKGTNIKTYEMLIYDRWGNLIFYTDDINKHWNGKTNNNSSEVVQQDVYVYAVKLSDNRDKKHKYIGTVTIAK